MPAIHRLITFTVVLTAFQAQRSFAGSLEDLNRLVRVDGADYVALRKEILGATSDPWDVGTAAKLSWKHGIIAFALNGRLGMPDAYTHWDEHARQSRADIAGRLYRFDRGGTTADTVAFLLEQSLKPQEGVEKQYAMGELLGRLQWAKSYAGIGNTEMWRAIWEECPYERLREASVFFLACSGDPEVQDILAGLLRDPDSPETRQLKVRCLTGLFHSESERAKALVLEEWDRLKSESLLGSAIAVLSTSADPRARELIYAVALDPLESIPTRRDTIAKLSNLHHRGDRAFLGRFFSEVDSVKLKREVLGSLWPRFPLDVYRSVVRDILETSSDPKLVGPAVSALVRGHHAPVPLRNSVTGEWDYGRRRTKVDRFDRLAWQEDVTLLEQLGARADLPEELQVQIEQYLAGMHELRRRFDGQSQPTEE